MGCFRSPVCLVFVAVLSSVKVVGGGPARSARETHKTVLPQDTYAIYNFAFQGHPSDIPGFSVPDPLSIPMEYELFSEFPYTMKISNTEFKGLSNLNVVYSEVDFASFSFHAAMNVPEVIVLGNITIITDLLYSTSYWSSLYNITVNGTAIVLRGNVFIDSSGTLQLNKEDMLFEIAYSDVQLKAENLPFWAETLIEDSADMFRSALQEMIKDWVPEFMKQALKTNFSMKFPDTEDLVSNLLVKPKVTFWGLRPSKGYVKQLGLSKILSCYDFGLRAENTHYRSRNSELSYINHIIRMAYETEVELLKVTGTCRFLFLKPMNFEIEMHNYLAGSEILFDTRKLSPPTIREVRSEIGSVRVTKPRLGEVNRSARSSVEKLPKKIWEAIQKKILQKEHWMSLDSQLNSLRITYDVSNRLHTLGSPVTGGGGSPTVATGTS
ncbi:uncharacterized protein [Macrobrachium rosenbergii]|uniref:uncharacterized protein isoform X1 n=1 Tax=Macrobrachium rosenbergii TaxID=79674 RepID=UPI0034D66BA1